MKLGILGLGSIGLRHAINAKIQGFEVIGFDPDSTRRKMLTPHKIEVVDDENILFDRCEAIAICSPNKLHLEHLANSIKHNCHVFIEKPLSHTLDQLEVIIEQANEKNLIIAPAMNMRFDDIVIKTKNIIEESTLNKPLRARFVCSAYLPDWRPHQDYKLGYTNDPKTGGAIFDIIHEFDMAYFLFGNMDVQSCEAKNSGLLGLDVEDTADISLLSRKENIPISIHLDYISKQSKRYFEINFSEHFLRADLNNRTVEVFDSSFNIMENLTDFNHDTKCYEYEIVAFLNALENGVEFPCSPREGLEVLELVINARNLAGLPS